MQEDTVKTWELVAAVIAVFGLVGLLLSGCAPGIAGAQQALVNAEELEVAAAKALEDFDEVAQRGIVARAVAAGNPEQGRQQLAAYRAKRAVVVKVLLDTGAILTAGAALLPLVKDGLKKQADVDAWLADLMAAALQVKVALAALGVELPAAPAPAAPAPSSAPRPSSGPVSMELTS